MNVRLADIAFITMGQSPQSTFYNQDRIGVPFIQGASSFKEFYPEINTWTTEYKKLAECNDLLFTVRAPVGKINIARENIAIGRGVASIRPKTTSYRYLYYLLSANINKFAECSTGTIYDSVNKEQLENVEFFIHNNTLQQHIVNTI